MIVIVCALGGGFYGWRMAKKREGTRADQAQYAVGFGIAFALLGMFITIFLERML